MKNKLINNPNAINPQRATIDKLSQIRSEASNQKPVRNQNQIKFNKTKQNGMHVTFSKSTKLSGDNFK